MEPLELGMAAEAAQWAWNNGGETVTKEAFEASLWKFTSCTFSIAILSSTTFEIFAIFAQVLGNEHPNTQTVFYNFADFLMTTIKENRTAELSDHPLTQTLLAQLRPNEH